METGLVGTLDDGGGRDGRGGVLSSTSLAGERASDEAIVILNDGTNSYIYYVLDGGDTGIEDDELTLIGIVSGEASLAASDIS